MVTELILPVNYNPGVSQKPIKLEISSCRCSQLECNEESDETECYSALYTPILPITDGNDTLFLSIPNTCVLKTLVTTSYESQVCYVLHVASPRIKEAKHSIISHVACNYTCIKNYSSFSFIALLFMPRLSEHERSGSIEC